MSEAFLAHRPAGQPPERPERLIAIRDGLAHAGLDSQCVELPVREATDDQLEVVHPASYLDRLKKACAAGEPYIDTPDSAICAESYMTARLAAGSILGSLDAVMEGSIKNAFCAVRPPGHHCEREESMGFCLLANAAIAARYLLDGYGLDRVAIVDWDVHHGNGTQHLLEESPEVMVCNIHGHPDHIYPGTGYACERGKGAGEGTTLNIPLMPGSGDADYRRAFDEVLLPTLDEYKPQFIIISAGFDAHERDPLAPLNLQSESFGWMTDRILEAADRSGGGRLVSVLEGGYNLSALSESVCHHVKSLMNATCRD
ncbi:MAG: histone deacetylase [Planctomycetes bacterium]|nr:histone deacetylase [Planctomycetota bacterium]